MSICRKKTIFWYLECFLSAMLAVWTFRILCRNGAADLCRLYETELSDFVMIALVLPLFSGIVLKKVADYMNYSKILNIGSRCRWQRQLMKELIKISAKYVLLLLGPMSFAAFILSESMRTPSEVVYGILTGIMYAIVLAIMAAVIMETKIRWNIDVAAVFSVLVIAFIPYVFTKLLIRTQVLTFSQILNGSYVFENGKYLWIVHETACVVALIILVIVDKIVSCQIKNKDFLWRHGANEN